MKELTLSERIYEVAKRYMVSISKRPLQNEEGDKSYYRQTKVFKIPMTILTVNAFESLCAVTQSATQYANRFQELTDEFVDFTSHVLPVLECYVDEEIELLYIRIPFGSSEDNSSAVTLYTHISDGRWISEKILLKWTLQILKSIFEAHKKFLTFPNFDTRDIFLLSDEFILASSKANAVAQRHRDAREQEELRRQRIASRVGSGGGSRPGSVGKAPNESPAARTTMVKFPPIGRGRKAKGSISTVATGVSMVPVIGDKLEIGSPIRGDSAVSKFDESSSISSSTVKADLSKRKIAPRKDAWLWFPLDGASEHLTQAASLVCDDLSHSTSSLHGVGEVTSEAFATSMTVTDYVICDGVTRSNVAAVPPTGDTSQGDDDMLRVFPPISSPQRTERENDPTLGQLDQQSSVTDMTDDIGTVGEDHGKARCDEILTEKMQQDNEIKAALERKRRYVNVNFSGLKGHQIHREYALNDTSYEHMVIRIHEKDPTEVGSKCRALYSSFIRAAYADLRCLGLVIVESYLRRNLTDFERVKLCKKDYLYHDLCEVYEMSRMTKGMKHLLQLCFSALPPVLIEEANAAHHRGVRDIRAPFIQQEEEVLRAISEDFWGMFGGISTRWGALGTDRVSLWTKEDQQKEDEERAAHIRRMADKAKHGVLKANRRNNAKRRQLWFDMLPQEQQEQLIRRKEAKKKSLANKAERDRLVKCALFHRWTMSKLQIWVKNAVLHIVKKNYYHKKTGVRLTLDEKHEWDRVVKPIEHALGKILLANPYVPPTVVVDGSQAMLMMLKSGAAPKMAVAAEPRKGDAKTSVASTVAGTAKKISAYPPGSPPTIDSRPSTGLSRSDSPVGYSRPTTADADASNLGSAEEATLQRGLAAVQAMKELDDMTNQEKDVRYNHAFQFVAMQLSDFLVSETGKSGTTNADYAVIKSSLAIAKHIREAVASADLTLSKSPIASLLPPLEYKEKLLAAAAKLLYDWDSLLTSCARLAALIGMREKSWTIQMIQCVSFALVVAYGADERVRDKGEAVAVSRLQAFCRGIIARNKIKEVWKLAEDQFVREEERRLAKLAEIEELNKISKRNIYKSSSSGSNDALLAKQKLAMDNDVEWVDILEAKPLSTGAAVKLSFSKGCRLPKEVQRRQLQIKSVSRILQQPVKTLDSNSCEYNPSTAEAGRGIVEICIDEVKHVLNLRQGWVEAGDVQLTESTIAWETEDMRYRRIQLGGVEDEGSCIVTVDGLIPNRNYQLKFMVSAGFRPKEKPTAVIGADNKQKAGRKLFYQGSPDTIRLSKAGSADLLTAPSFPCPPCFQAPDVMHFDHVILDRNKSNGPNSKVSEHASRSAGGDDLDEANGDTSGLSVVDKLEHFKRENSYKRHKKTSAHRGGLIDMTPPMPHSSGATERRVSCRVAWSVSDANGSVITEYELQRKNISGADGKSASWTILAAPMHPFYTDTVPVFNERLGVLNSTFCYRVRAKNGYGWSEYSDVITADLIDKISCKSPQRSTSQYSEDGEVYYGTITSSAARGLLPHGITLRSESAGSRLTKTAVGATVQHIRKKTADRSGISLISEDQQTNMLHEDMLSVPPTFQGQQALVDISSPGGSSPTAKGNCSMNRGYVQSSPAQPKYGHDPVLSADSCLSGDSLEGVHRSLESWLCRLADACPLEASKPPLVREGLSVNHSTDREHSNSEDNSESAQKELIGRISARVGRKIPTAVLDTLYLEADMNPKQVPMQQTKQKKFAASPSLDTGAGVGRSTENGMHLGQKGSDNVLLQLARVHVATHDIKESAVVPSKLQPNKMFALH